MDFFSTNGFSRQWEQLKGATCYESNRRAPIVTIQVVNDAVMTDSRASAVEYEAVDAGEAALAVAAVAVSGNFT